LSFSFNPAALESSNTNYYTFDGVLKLYNTNTSMYMKCTKDVGYISAISWRPVLVVKEAGVLGESTTDHGQATGKHYHLRLRVECTLLVIYKAGREPSGVKTPNKSSIKINQPYHGKNKLHFDEMMMISTLY
jgi:hypothetical protein